jgi:thioredoxin-like negative regulator of GroEL
MQAPIELTSPIVHLEYHDFTADGHLVPTLLQQPVLVMFQVNTCHHCQVAKPAFQALANGGVVKCMTVQPDGERPSEHKITEILKTKIYPTIPGYPSYMIFMPDGQRIAAPPNMQRDAESLLQFFLNSTRENPLANLEGGVFKRKPAKKRMQK